MPDSPDIYGPGGPGGWERWARRHAAGLLPERGAQKKPADPRRNAGAPDATMTDEQEVTQAALAGLGTRVAGVEHITPPAIAEAVRRPAGADLAVQSTKRSKSTQ